MRVNKPQYERLLALDREIREKKYPNAISFGKLWEVNAKTVQRDIAFLRDRLGAPVVFDRGRNGYAYSEASWFMPAFSVMDVDLRILKIARLALEQYPGTTFARELDNLLERFLEIGGDRMNSNLLEELELESMFSFRAEITAPVNGLIWRRVVDAVRFRQSIIVDYRTAQGTLHRNEQLDPYHLTCLAGIWYLLAWSHRREHVVQYALSRVLMVEMTDDVFKVRDGICVEDMVNNAFGRVAATDEAVNVRVKLGAKLGPWVSNHIWHPKQHFTKNRDGSVTVQFPVSGGSSHYPFMQVVRWVLSWGSEAEVLEPEYLRELVAQEIRGMSKKLSSRQP